MSKESDKKEKKPTVHKDLDGFDVNIDAFGELKSNLSIDAINSFLNKNVDDKKLRDREDLDDIKNQGYDEEE